MIKTALANESKRFMDLMRNCRRIIKQATKEQAKIDEHYLFQFYARGIPLDMIVSMAKEFEIDYNQEIFNMKFLKHGLREFRVK